MPKVEAGNDQQGADTTADAAPRAAPADRAVKGRALAAQQAAVNTAVAQDQLDQAANRPATPNMVAALSPARPIRRALPQQIIDPNDERGITFNKPFGSEPGSYDPMSNNGAVRSAAEMNTDARRDLPADEPGSPAGAAASVGAVTPRAAAAASASVPAADAA